VGKAHYDDDYDDDYVDDDDGDDNRMRPAEAESAFMTQIYVVATSSNCMVMLL
jgi:hypothetical protein